MLSPRAQQQLADAIGSDRGAVSEWGRFGVGVVALRQVVARASRTLRQKKPFAAPGDPGAGAGAAASAIQKLGLLPGGEGSSGGRS